MLLLENWKLNLKPIFLNHPVFCLLTLLPVFGNRSLLPGSATVTYFALAHKAWSCAGFNFLVFYYFNLLEVKQPLFFDLLNLQLSLKLSIFDAWWPEQSLPFIFQPDESKVYAVFKMHLNLILTSVLNCEEALQIF